ncbi:hypothetical protein TNCV_2864311 [Trichonephila clavipes]|nr:hypothetical protein TNCV_2864311 [Trichonephila clavipes]
MCLTAWFLLWWIDGATTSACERCNFLCPARVINEGRFELSTLSENKDFSHRAKAIAVACWLISKLPRHRWYPTLQASALDHREYFEQRKISYVPGQRIIQ